MHHTLNSLDTQLSVGTPPSCCIAFQPSGLPTGLQLVFLDLALLALSSPSPGLSQLGNKYNKFNWGQEWVTCMELIAS